MRLPGGRHLNDLAVFAATVAVAAWQEWSATDLVWSLWISSLVVGYAFVVVTLMVGDAGVGGNGATGTKSPIRGPARKVLALFVLGFFTVHFGGFHYGHSVFLNEFFPLVERTAGDASGIPGPAWWGDIVATAAVRYWPFLLATAFSRRADFVRSVEEDPDPRKSLFRPYRNVVRMHLLIFVFAGLDAAGLSGWAVYPVLFFYFFPLDAVTTLLRGREPAAA